MLKKFPLDKINGTKNALCFLSRAHDSFIFNSQFLYYIMCGIFHFRFRLVFIKLYYFCSTKSVDSWTLKHHNSFQNKNKRKAIHSFVWTPLVFNLQQEA